MQSPIHRDTRAWQLQVWRSFLLAAFPCGVGLARDDEARGETE